MTELVVTPEELKRGVALEAGAFHRIVVLRGPALARVLGKAFDTNKSLLLPGAARKMARIRGLLVKRPPTHLLVVGHCDTTGDDAVNDPLSFERAQTTVAFLKDDIGAWLDMYGSSAPQSRRWGHTEDLVMISAMQGFATKPNEVDAISWFQETRGLEGDGIAGPITREALISEYMLLDGPSFGELGLTTDFTAHGAGEHFPLDESGRKVDKEHPDNKSDALDRRVEFFFFSQKHGVLPPSPGTNSNKNSPEYPEWRKRGRLEFETVLAEGESDYFVRLHVDPTRKAELNDRLRLFSEDGQYDQTKVVSEDGEAESEFIDMPFTRVLVNLSYTLEMTTEGGISYHLFENIPFDKLDGLTEQPPEVDDSDPLETEPGLDDDGNELAQA